MTNEVIRRVLDEKRAAKRRAAAEAEARKTAALSLPDVAEAHREYVYALHESLRYGGADKKSRAKTAYENYTAALSAAGYSESDFEPRTECGLCGDTGIHDGRLCKCVRNEFIRALGVACDLSPEGFALSDFTTEGVHGTQAAELGKIYAKMTAYAEKFQD